FDGCAKRGKPNSRLQVWEWQMGDVREILGGDARVSQRQRPDAYTEPDSRSTAREIGEQCDRLEERLVAVEGKGARRVVGVGRDYIPGEDHVVTGPERVVAQLLDTPRQQVEVGRRRVIAPRR